MNQMIDQKIIQAGNIVGGDHLPGNRKIQPEFTIRPDCLRGQ
jgi:hypothetical protein